MKAQNRDGIHNVMYFASWIYAIGAMIAIPYYNWQYAKGHGFISWLVFGEVIATLKALFWPVWLTLNQL